MKKKIFIGSIFAAILILMMPMVSNIQAQQQITVNENEKCLICSETVSFENTNIKVPICMLVAALKTVLIHIASFMTLITTGVIIMIPLGYYQTCYNDCMNN